jgi:hypothetical protein
MARLAYCRKEPVFGFDRDQITGILKSQGSTAAKFFESKGTPDGRGTHCLLASDPARKLAIVAFRGTDASDPTICTTMRMRFKFPGNPAEECMPGSLTPWRTSRIPSSSDRCSQL